MDSTLFPGFTLIFDLLDHDNSHDSDDYIYDNNQDWDNIGDDSHDPIILKVLLADMTLSTLCINLYLKNFIQSITPTNL